MTRVGTLAGVVVGALLFSGAAPAGAEQGWVPREPNIVDPAGDANYLYLVDQPGPINLPEADILAAWFTGNGKRLTAHWQVAASPVGKDVAFATKAYSSPSPIPRTRISGSGCLWFTVRFPPAGNAPYAYGGDGCAGPLVLSRPEVRKLPDGSVVISTTYPFTSGFPLRSGDVLVQPFATSGHVLADPATGTYHDVPRIDVTNEGTDYRIP